MSTVIDAGTDIFDAAEGIIEEANVTNPQPPAGLRLSRAALAVAMMSATEDSRPVLAHIWAKGNRLQSADGFMAASVEVPDELPEGFAIPRADALAAVKKTRAKFRDITALPHEDGTATLGFSNKPGEFLRVKGSLGEATAPNVDDILHKDVPRAVACIDVKRLKQVATFLETALDDGDKNSAAPMAEIRMYGHSSAIEFRGLTPDEHGVRAMVMPMVRAYRDSDEDWLLDPVEGISPAGVSVSNLRKMLSGPVADERLHSAPVTEQATMVTNLLAGLGYDKIEIDAALAVLGMNEETDDDQ